MKHRGRLTIAVLAVMVLLCGCKKQQPETTWQTILPNTGVSVELSGCEVSESTDIWYPEDGSPGQELCLLRVTDVPTLTWYHVTAENVEVAFVLPNEGGYQGYSTSKPIEKVDYCPQDAGEDSLQYRFDTAYSFIITVTTDQGTDRFLLDARRDI